MRRLTLLGLALLAFSFSTSAQIGKRVVIQAGTPEDKALQEIGTATDAAKKLELLAKFVADYGSTDTVLAAYEIYSSHYLAEKNTAKVYEIADKALAIDPDNFNLAFNALRAAQEGGDTAKLFHYGGIVGGILTRYKVRPAPEGTEAEVWAAQKRSVLGDLQSNIAYAEYSLINTGNSTKDPAQKAQLLERYVLAFPDGQYAFTAATLTADAYRQARQGAKMVEFGERALQQDPNHYGILVQLADYWAEGKEQPEKAIQYANKALTVLASAQQPANLTPEQWMQQKNLQIGLAQSAIGQVHVNNNRDADSVGPFKAAAPLLKPFNFYYARCLYLWGFALARQKKAAEARPILTEAASLDTPYKPLAEETLSKIGGPGKATKAAKKRT